MKKIRRRIDRDKLVELGFEYDKTYKHNEFTTARYIKGVISAEITYIGFKYHSFDVTIDEVNCLDVNKTELVILDNILNKNNG